jgi:hypothetical protein|tara:strand:+ start:13725 stop:14078 length:354 start_codon:yes stop_codon:yes gene_type:complete
MKNLIAILVLSTFSLISFSQGELADNSVKPKTEIISKSIRVKLKNNSLRSYRLYIPNVIELESVRLGTNTFCMAQGQEMYLVLEGKNYLLLTANSADRNSYNLRRLVKKRKNKLGLN